MTIPRLTVASAVVLVLILASGCANGTGGGRAPSEAQDQNVALAPVDAEVEGSGFWTDDCDVSIQPIGGLGNGSADVFSIRYGTGNSVRLELRGAKPGSARFPARILIPNFALNTARLSLDDEGAYTLSLSGFDDQGSVSVTLRDPEGNVVVANEDRWENVEITANGRLRVGQTRPKVKLVPLYGDWAALRVAYRGFFVTFFIRA